MIKGNNKMGFLRWAFSGGVYFGDVQGSGFGSVGIALVGPGAFKIWKAMAMAPTPELRAKLLPLFLVVGILGIAAAGVGYFHYLTANEIPRPPSC